MNKITKIIIPAIILFTVYVYYILSPSDELGSFEKIREAGEINQSIKVRLDKSMGIDKDRNNNVVTFYALDRYDEHAKVGLQKPAAVDISNAEIIEIFGHMHGNNFIALNIEVVKRSE
jgi:hypothetical protein